MLAHGKLASQFIRAWPRGAPASKSRQVAGAGASANAGASSGNRASNRRDDAQTQSRRGTAEAARSAQNMANDAIQLMMCEAQKLAKESANEDGSIAIAKLWMARAIAAEVVRMQTRT